MVEQITAGELKKLNQDSNNTILIVDIRNADVFAEEHIPGAINIDVYDDIWMGNVEDVEEKLSTLPKDKKIIAVCNTGRTTQLACQVLGQLGYKSASLKDGMEGWG